MAKIEKIIRMVNKGNRALIYVTVEDGDEEYLVIVGGEVELFHHNGINRAFVRKSAPTNLTATNK